MYTKKQNQQVEGSASLALCYPSSMMGLMDGSRYTAVKKIYDFTKKYIVVWTSV